MKRLRKKFLVNLGNDGFMINIKANIHVVNYAKKLSTSPGPTKYKHMCQRTIIRRHPFCSALVNDFVNIFGKSGAIVRLSGAIRLIFLFFKVLSSQKDF